MPVREIWGFVDSQFQEDGREEGEFGGEPDPRLFGVEVIDECHKRLPGVCSDGKNVVYVAPHDKGLVERRPHGGQGWGKFGADCDTANLAEVLAIEAEGVIVEDEFEKV